MWVSNGANVMDRVTLHYGKYECNKISFNLINCQNNQTTQSHMPRDSYLHSHRSANLKSLSLFHNVFNSQYSFL